MRTVVLISLLLLAILAACRLTTEEPLFGTEPGLDLIPTEDIGRPDTTDVSSPDIGISDMIDAEDAADLPQDPDITEEEPVIERITWVGSIAAIFDNRCVSCHRWASSYAQVEPRCASGSMEYYIEIGHFISGQERQTTLDWLAQGYPEE